jgi:hypothetical protein
MTGVHEDTGYTSKRFHGGNCHYPFLGILPEGAGETADINALYAARFGVPPAGKRVFIRTVQQINGWQERPQTFSARVPPAERPVEG